MAATHIPEKKWTRNGGRTHEHKVLAQKKQSEYSRCSRHQEHHPIAQRVQHRPFITSPLFANASASTTNQRPV